MTEQLTTTTESAISKLILKGDIGKLNDTEKVQYYHALCQRLGIDPMTKPFDYVTMQGRESLYLNKGGAEQLNRVHNVSMSISHGQKIDEIYIVTARAAVGDRFNDATGAVNVKTLQGDALANALMRAETKAKRRATIGLLGLAMLDETEVDTIPHAKTREAKVEVIEEPTVTVDEWEKLNGITKANHWPSSYVLKWVQSQRTQGKTDVDIYQEALVKFGQLNVPEAAQSATAE
jgi:hypothetical protein